MTVTPDNSKSRQKKMPLGSGANQVSMSMQFVSSAQAQINSILVVANAPARCREWWAAEAVRAGTDWSGVVPAALEMIVAAVTIEQPQPETMIPCWDAPSWRDAVEYHDQPAGRRTTKTIGPECLARLRRLMADDISVDRAWHELEADRPAPKATVD